MLRHLTELHYFSVMLCYGAVVAAAYHPLVFLRTFLHHSIPWVDAEDILFLIGAGLGFFYVSYEWNDGILRWYSFACFLGGCLIYWILVGKRLESFRKWILQKRKKKDRIKAEKKANNKEDLPAGRFGTPETEIKDGETDSESITGEQT